LKFLIFRRSDRWRWRLVSRNGRTMAESVPYRNRLDCMSGVEMAKSVNADTPVENVSQRESENVVGSAAL
jgi:uncharacterized protein YegP (UPF0339 family)